MHEVKQNDFVTVTYEGFLQNGEVFESSKDSGPLVFRVGAHMVLPRFEQEVLGMKLHETKTFEIQPEEAFGQKQSELVHTIKSDSIKVQTEIKPGIVLGLTIEKDGENHKVPALVTEIKGDDITVDFNHPLAGQILKYQVTIDAISDTDPSEKKCGYSPQSNPPPGGKDCGC